VTVPLLISVLITFCIFVISVFECAESNVVIVQQRTPLIKVV